MVAKITCSGTGSENRPHKSGSLVFPNRAGQYQVVTYTSLRYQRWKVSQRITCTIGVFTSREVSAWTDLQLSGRGLRFCPNLNKYEGGGENNLGGGEARFSALDRSRRQATGIDSLQIRDICRNPVSSVPYLFVTCTWIGSSSLGDSRRARQVLHKQPAGANLSALRPIISPVTKESICCSNLFAKNTHNKIICKLQLFFVADAWGFHESESCTFPTHFEATFSWSAKTHYACLEQKNERLLERFSPG